MPTENTLRSALTAWRTEIPLSISPLGQGNINDTWLATYDDARFVLQRINQRVFRQPQEVMENVSRVTLHLERAAPKKPHLKLISTKNGADWHTDKAGEIWRLYPYFPDTFTLGPKANDEQLYSAARLFGEFLVSMRSLPAPRLHITIEGFHDTTRYLAALKHAINANLRDRIKKCRHLISQLQDLEWLAGTADKIRNNPGIPTRIVHNDCKLDNVLFDKSSGTPVCVIDLDTVMPGFTAWDYGDLIRSGASTSCEDADPADNAFDRHRFSALHEGYLEATADILTNEERYSLELAPQIVAYELSVRFLTDYLIGDVYFKTTTDKQNLRRATNQCTLASSGQTRY